MGELLVGIGELLLHILFYSILGAFKIVMFIFNRQKRETLIKEWHTSVRDKAEIIIGGFYYLVLFHGLFGILAQQFTSIIIHVKKL